MIKMERREITSHESLLVLQFWCIQSLPISHPFSLEFNYPGEFNFSLVIARLFCDISTHNKLYLFISHLAPSFLVSASIIRHPSSIIQKGRKCWLIGVFLPRSSRNAYCLNNYESEQIVAWQSLIFLSILSWCVWLIWRFVIPLMNRNQL